MMQVCTALLFCKHACTEVLLHVPHVKAEQKESEAVTPESTFQLHSMTQIHSFVVCHVGQQYRQITEQMVFNQQLDNFSQHKSVLPGIRNLRRKDLYTTKSSSKMDRFVIILSYRNVMVSFVRQSENWLGNVLDICVKLSPVNLLFNISYKNSFNRLHLLTLYNLTSKVFNTSREKHNIFFQDFLKDLLKMTRKRET